MDPITMSGKKQIFIKQIKTKQKNKNRGSFLTYNTKGFLIEKTHLWIMLDLLQSYKAKLCQCPSVCPSVLQ